MFKKLVGITGFICLLSSPLLASEMNSQSVSATLETEFRNVLRKGENWIGKPISVTVKMYENGDFYVDNAEFSVARYQNTFQDGDYEVNAKILGMYREELHRQIGYQQGTRFVDLKVGRIIKLNSVDNITYRIEGEVQIERSNHISTNDENNFLSDSGEEFDFRNNGLSTRYGVSVGADYEWGDDAIVKVRASYSKYDDSFYNEDNKEQKYDFSKAERKIEFNIKPNRKKCHTFNVGVRQVEYGQGTLGMNDSFKDTEIYGNYSCRFDMEKLFFPESDTSSGNLIRH